MASRLARIGFRVAVIAAICVLAFYIGRPLYWKVTATLQEIREKDYTNAAVKHGFSELMHEAQMSVGWGSGDTTDMQTLQEVELKIAQLEKEQSAKSQDSGKASTDDSKDSAKESVDAKSGKSSESKVDGKSRKLTRRLFAS